MLEVPCHVLEILVSKKKGIIPGRFFLCKCHRNEVYLHKTSFLEEIPHFIASEGNTQIPDLQRVGPHSCSAHGQVLPNPVLSWIQTYLDRQGCHNCLQHSKVAVCCVTFEKFAEACYVLPLVANSLGNW